MGTLKQHWLLVLGLTLALWWLMTGDVPVLDLLRSFVGRGKRLTSTALDDDGNIPESPEALAGEASRVLGRDVDVDAYTLARIADSEHPTASLREKAAIMRVALNDAAAHGWSVGYTATVGKGYGRQSGRRYSTARDPYEQTLVLAEAVMAGAVADETRGSTHFVHKTGFATIAAYTDLVERWEKSLKIVPVALDGIPSFRLFLPANWFTAEDVLPAMEGTA